MQTTLSPEKIVSDIRHKLDAMIGKKFKYSNGEYLFKKYVIYQERERVEIITDKSNFDRTFDAVLGFLQFFKKIEDVKVTPASKENGHVPSGVIVYATSDYSRFNFLKGNRTLNDSKIKKIIAEIEDGNDMLRYYPIQVKESYDERLAILDGQHRFFICKKLNKPVYYIIVEEDKSMVEIAKINSNVDKWKADDFINCYIEHGNDNYKLLSRFLKTYGVSLTVALQLLANGNPGSDHSWFTLTDDFKNGSYKVKKYEEAEMLLNECKLFSDFPNFRSRSFVIAIYRIKKAGLISIEDLVCAYKKRPEMLTQQVNYKAYVNTLEQILNIGKQKRILIL